MKKSLVGFAWWLLAACSSDGTSGGARVDSVEALPQTEETSAGEALGTAGVVQVGALGAGSRTYDSAEALAAGLGDAVAAGHALGGIHFRLIDAPVAADALYVTVCAVDVQYRSAPGDAMAAAGEPLHESERVRPEDAGVRDAAPMGDRVVDAGRHRAENHASFDGGHDGADGGAPDGQWGWVRLRDECTSTDLLTLQEGAFEELGFAALPAGRYGQIRLRLEESSAVIDGEEHPLVVPSAASSGLKVSGGFDVAVGEVTVVTLDFDAARSLHVDGAGKYHLRPVLFLASAERKDAHGSNGETSEHSAMTARPDERGEREAASAPKAHGRSGVSGATSAIDGGAPSAKKGPRKPEGASPSQGMGGGRGSQPRGGHELE